MEEEELLDVLNEGVSFEQLLEGNPDGFPDQVSITIWNLKT